jgi:hypothetical protein
MLGGELAVLQAPMLDGLSFEPFTLLDDGCGPAEPRRVCRRLFGLSHAAIAAPLIMA